MYFENSILYLNNTPSAQFINNTKTYYGGAIFVDFSATLGALE